MVRSRLAPQPSEYGPACLAMLSDFYGKHITLFKSARLCGVTLDGCAPEQIRFGAEELGFKTMVSGTDIKTLKKQKRPCIVTVDGNYAVLERICAGKAVLATPYAGRVKMPISAFEISCGEQALFLMPPEKGFSNEENGSGLFRFILSLIFGYNPVSLIVYMLLMGAVSFILLKLPYAVSLATDIVYLTDLKAKGYTWFIFGDAITFLIVLFILELLIIPGFTRFSVNISTYCRKYFVWASFNLPIDSYQIRSDGYFLKSADDVKDFGYFLSKQVVDAFLRPILALLFLKVIFDVSKPSFIVVLISLIIMFALTFISAGYDNNKGNIFFSDQCKESGFLIEGVKAIRSMINTGSEFVYFREYMELNRQSAKSEKPYLTAGNLFNNIPVFISNFTKLLLIVTGAYGILKGELLCGDLICVHGTYCIIQEYIKNAIMSGKAILSAKYQLENMYEICLESEVSTDRGSTGVKSPDKDTDYKKLTGHITLNHINFGYSKYSGEILKDISMDIPAGSSVAIVGSSGSGKTTLKNLICGRHKPWSGEILYDDTNREEIPDVVLENSIASVDQLIIMFEDTVMHNIKMWDVTQIDADAIMAARDSEIHDVIISREGKYRTKLAEGGANFSGGERQRIEIARALSMDPTILILDEATSALDTIVEKRIVDNIRKRGITTIVIAHRLSTVRSCDYIYVMDNGRFVDRGTHDQLMRSCDIYRRLVTVE